MIKPHLVQAALRTAQYSVTAGWFESMSREAQEEYLREHPNSSHNPDNRPNSNSRPATAPSPIALKASLKKLEDAHDDYEDRLETVDDKLDKLRDQLKRKREANSLSMKVLKWVFTSKDSKFKVLKDKRKRLIEDIKQISVKIKEVRAQLKKAKVSTYRNTTAPKDNKPKSNKPKSNKPKART